MKQFEKMSKDVAKKIKKVKKASGAKMKEMDSPAKQKTSKVMARNQKKSAKETAKNEKNNAAINAYNAKVKQMKKFIADNTTGAVGDSTSFTPANVEAVKRLEALQKELKKLGKKIK